MMTFGALHAEETVDGFILRSPGIGRCSLVKNIGLQAASG